MDTNRLIERLAQEAQPAPPLPRPWIRAAVWLGGVVVYLAAISFPMTSSADLAANSIGWKFLLPQLAAIVTAAAAAVAAFASTVPGYSRRILWLPAVAGLVWLGSLTGWSLQEWHQGVSVAEPREWLCVAMIAGGGAVPAVFMAMMLRRGAPLAPGVTIALGALAVTGLANVVACLSRPHPNSAVVLVWHGLTIAALVAIAAWMGRDLLSWQRLRAGVLRSGNAA
jgi:hypothetical protein